MACGFQEIRHLPRSLAAADVIEEVAKDIDTMRRVRDFWMELETMKIERAMLHCRMRTRRSRCEGLELIR